MSEQVTWASIIKEIIRMSGWSQRELADKMGVTEATISRWENGVALRPSGPSRKLLMRIRTELLARRARQASQAATT